MNYSTENDIILNMSESCTMFICHYGLERSKAAARALTESGLPATHFIGGTRAIGGMAESEIKDRLGDCASVVLIYDQGSRNDEYQHKLRALDKLHRVGIYPVEMSSHQIAILLHENGKNIDDYLP